MGAISIAAASGERVVIATLRPFQLLLAQPWLMFLTFLAAALLRPPSLALFPWDRYVFAVLLFNTTLFVFATRKPLYFGRVVGLPSLLLMLLSASGIVTHAYDPQAWSVFAAKWLVPFVLFHIAGFLAENTRFAALFEKFALLALAYLIFTSVAFLFDARELIFPRFILDDSLGMHAERARGPFLQAVANGMALNLLGLVALNAYRRKVLRGVLAFVLLAGLPLAILATKTRSVWLGFGGSVLLLLFRSSSKRLRGACAGLALAGVLALVACVSVADANRSLADRLEDRSPVEFRMAVYRAGWEMFQLKPLFGWGASAMQRELSLRISEFHQDEYYFHNTYLEMLVERGLLGLGLYLWLVVDLFRVGKRVQVRPAGFFDEEFRSLWPVFVLVFLLNASFVVMNYQFVNGLLFSIAGMLAAQNRMSLEGARHG